MNSSVSAFEKEPVPVQEANQAKALLVLQELKSFLYTGDFKASQTFKAQLPLLQSSLDAQTFAPLNQKMKDYDFVEALKIIELYLEQHT